MRHVLSLLLAACLVLAGCGSSNPVPVPEQRLKQPIDKLMEQLCDYTVLPMPTSLDGELLEKLLDIPPEQAIDFAGYISMSSDCPDRLVAVQAADGCAEQVAKSLETHRTMLLEAYADSAVAVERVAAGQVVFRGNYIFLVIAGRQGQPPTDEVTGLIKMIEDNFEK